jgi:hypothetical protein
MRELEPVSSEVLAHYRANRCLFIQVSDSLQGRRFSQALRIELLKFLPDADAVSLVEAVFLIGDYGNHKELKRQEKAVAKLLKKDGVRVPPGKRPNQGLMRLVGDMTPLLLHFGLPLASSERSRLVLCLRLLADEAGLQGDPRGELRRRVAEKRKRKLIPNRTRDLPIDFRPELTAASWGRMPAGLRVAVRAAVARGLSHLKVSYPAPQPPPIYPPPQD